MFHSGIWRGGYFGSVDISIGIRPATPRQRARRKRERELSPIFRSREIKKNRN